MDLNLHTVFKEESYETERAKRETKANQDLEITPGESTVINNLCQLCYSLAGRKGFHPSSGPLADTKPEKLALIHSEVSEVLEALRHGNPRDKHVPELTSEAAELADVMIRVMDYAHAFNIDLGRAVRLKHQFNLGRPYKHGKQF